MYKVISFDLFVTLAKLEDRLPVIWERILGYKPKTAELHGHIEGLLTHYLPDYFSLCTPPFVTMSDVFFKGFREYFKNAGLNLDPERANEIFLEEHNYCPIYEDAQEIIPRIAKKYRIVISTDADICMVRGIIDRVPHEAAFVSEELAAYKAYADGSFFKRVIEETGVHPYEILHIGDGRSDLIGASICGIDTYHVDRENAGIAKGVPTPTYSSHDLYKLADILAL